MPESRTQARGHRTAAEALNAPHRLKRINAKDFDIALKELRSGKSLHAAAKKIKVSPERLRNQAFAEKQIELKGKHWVIREFPKKLPIYSQRQKLNIEIGDEKTQSEIGRYFNAVQAFLNRKPRELDAFRGKSVTDTQGRSYIFETRHNEVYKLARSGAEPIDFYAHS